MSEPQERWLRLAAILALVGLGLVVWSLFDPRPIPIIVSMSVGQIIGTASFVIYLAVVMTDLRRRLAAGRAARRAAAAATAGAAAAAAMAAAAVDKAKAGDETGAEAGDGAKSGTTGEDVAAERSPQESGSDQEAP